MVRYTKLLRRFLAARRLGITFIGTTKSKLPGTVKLGGRAVQLAYPPESDHLSDIINIWLDDEYGITRLKAKPVTVVDVGGNIGLFSLWVWHHFPDARITTIEPNPRVLDCLTHNLAPTRAAVMRCGVGGASGFASLNDCADSRQASTTPAARGDIELRAMGEIVAEVGGKIDLLKMDCEGAEWDIFEDKAAFEFVDAIRMEYHLDGFHSLETLKSITEDLGFRMIYHCPNNWFGIAWLERVERLAHA